MKLIEDAFDEEVSAQYCQTLFGPAADLIGKDAFLKLARKKLKEFEQEEE
jgi:hypothetical protein